MPFKLFSKKEDTNDKKETFYPVCPNCISPQLEIVKEFTSGWLTTPRYHCPNCNYSGILKLEVEVSLFDNNTPEEIKRMFLEEESEFEDK